MSISRSSSAALHSVSMATRNVPALEGQRVYNLTVLVRQLESGEALARAANISLDEVQAGSIRSALSKMVAAMKSLIAEHVVSDKPIPWIDPPMEPTEQESRFMVPLHL